MLTAANVFFKNNAGTYVSANYRKSKLENIYICRERTTRNLLFCHCLTNNKSAYRRGITMRLKRLKPRASDFGGSQTFRSKNNFRHFCIQLYLYFCFGSTHLLLLRRYQKISIEECARKIEENDDEHSLSMALRIGYSHV